MSLIIYRPTTLYDPLDIEYNKKIILPASVTLSCQVENAKQFIKTNKFNHYLYIPKFTKLLDETIVAKLITDSEVITFLKTTEKYQARYLLTILKCYIPSKESISQFNNIVSGNNDTVFLKMFAYYRVFNYNTFLRKLPQLSQFILPIDIVTIMAAYCFEPPPTINLPTFNLKIHLCKYIGSCLSMEHIPSISVRVLNKIWFGDYKNINPHVNTEVIVDQIWDYLLKNINLSPINVKKNVHINHLYKLMQFVPPYYSRINLHKLNFNQLLTAQYIPFRNQKEIDDVKLIFITKLITNKTPCQCQFGQECHGHIKKAYHRTYPPIIAGSDFQRKKYTKVSKEKILVGKNYHCQLHIMNGKIEKVTTFTRTDHPNKKCRCKCDVATYLSCFRFKTPEVKLAILEWLGYEIENDSVSVTGTIINISNDQNIVFIKQSHDKIDPTVDPDISQYTVKIIDIIFAEPDKITTFFNKVQLITSFNFETFDTNTWLPSYQLSIKKSEEKDTFLSLRPINSHMLHLASIIFDQRLQSKDYNQNKFVDYVKYLLNMCEDSHGPNIKALYATAIINYVFTYKDFMYNHSVFLLAVVNKINEFIMDRNNVAEIKINLLILVDDIWDKKLINIPDDITKVYQDNINIPKTEILLTCIRNTINIDTDISLLTIMTSLYRQIITLKRSLYYIENRKPDIDYHYGQLESNCQKKHDKYDYYHSLEYISKVKNDLKELIPEIKMLCYVQIAKTEFGHICHQLIEADINFGSLDN